MTGAFMGELRAACANAKSRIECLGRLDLEGIRTRFSGLDHVDEQVDVLVSQLPPTPPLSPEPTWTAESWVSWAATQYIPYDARRLEAGEVTATSSRRVAGSRLTNGSSSSSRRGRMASTPASASRRCSPPDSA